MKKFDKVNLQNPPDEYVHYDASLGKLIGNNSGQIYPDFKTAVSQNSNMDKMKYLQRLGIENSSTKVDGYPKNYPNKIPKPSVEVKNNYSFAKDFKNNFPNIKDKTPTVKNNKMSDWVDAHTHIYDGAELTNKNNPYVKTFHKTGGHFTMKNALEDKKFKKDFKKEYSNTAMRKDIVKRRNNNIRKKLPEHHGFSDNDILLDSIIRDEAKEVYEAVKKIPAMEIDTALPQIEKQVAAPAAPVKTFQDHYNDVVERENNTKGLRAFAPILKGMK
jgi:hypothetical protein